MTRVFCECCGELKRIDAGSLSYGYEAGSCIKCQPEDKREDSPEDSPEDLPEDTSGYRFI